MSACLCLKDRCLSVVTCINIVSCACCEVLIRRVQLCGDTCVLVHKVCTLICEADALLMLRDLHLIGLMLLTGINLILGHSRSHFGLLSRLNALHSMLIDKFFHACIVVLTIALRCLREVPFTNTKLVTDNWWALDLSGARLEVIAWLQTVLLASSVLLVQTLLS